MNENCVDKTNSRTTIAKKIEKGQEHGRNIVIPAPFYFDKRTG